jgi:hypothetical protein
MDRWDSRAPGENRTKGRGLGQVFVQVGATYPIRNQGRTWRASLTVAREHTSLSSEGVWHEAEDPGPSRQRRRSNEDPSPCRSDLVAASGGELSEEPDRPQPPTEGISRGGTLRVAIPEFPLGLAGGGSLAEPFELSTDQGVVLGQESTPSAILEPGGVFRRAHDVGEEHRGQNAPAPRASPHDRSVHQGESADNALFSTCYLCQVKPKSGGRTATTVAAQRAKMGV